MTFRFRILASLLSFTLLIPFLAAAQERLSLSVVPPLVQLSVGPGDTWNGFLKVINSNAYDLTVYATVVDFAAQGETGQGRFIPLDEAALLRGERTTLGSWISVPDSPVTVKQEQSGGIPVSITVPVDASPGGHYAAVLIGTGPRIGAADGAEGNAVKVSSFVTTLLFVRVAGDVIEDADIREFWADRPVVGSPKAELLIRFENRGNVHVLPQGAVTVYNMFGKERGVIPVNQKTDFGSVLPGTARRYSLTWEGEPGLLEFGRYRAEADLAYGQDGRKTVSSVAYFWVIPVVPVSTVLSIILVVTALIVFTVRRYVRRTLDAERRRLGVSDRPGPSPQQKPRSGVIDLRKGKGWFR